MNHRLRGALVGYGFIANEGHAAAYDDRAQQRNDVDIVAVADITPARRALVKGRWPQARLYPDLPRLLAAERGNLDFVDVCVPPAYHAAAVHAALDSGLHVLCEKPLATSADEARRMLTHARHARRVLFPCHNYKHAPVIRAVREVLASERIGQVHLITMQTFRHTHARGVPEWQPDWRRERRHAGGGIAMDHGSHTFYLAFEWMRALPTAVSARLHSSAGLDTEDDVQCSLSFPTGTVSAHLSWNAGVRKVLYTLHGSGGAIRVEDDEMEVAVREPTSPQPGAKTAWAFERRTIESNWMDASHVTWFNSMFDDFKQAIATHDFVGKDAQEAFFCVQLIEAAYRSGEGGGAAVHLPTTLPAWDERRASSPAFARGDGAPEGRPRPAEAPVDGPVKVISDLRGDVIRPAMRG